MVARTVVVVTPAVVALETEKLPFNSTKLATANVMSSAPKRLAPAFTVMSSVGSALPKSNVVAVVLVFF